MKRRKLLHMTMLLSTVALLGTGGWVETAHAADQVIVEVRMIAAAQGEQHMDPSLSDLRGTLGVTFAGYTSFRQLSSQTLSLSKGVTQGVKLPNGSVMTLTFNGFAGSLVKLGVDLAQRLKTTLRLTPDSPFFQAWKQRKGGLLILGIKVTKA